MLSVTDRGWRFRPVLGREIKEVKKLGRTGLIGSLVFLVLWSCGYRLEGRGTSLPPEIQTVAIPTMENRTVEAGIENVFTTALVREFNFDGRLKVIPQKRADSILDGTIQDFLVTSVSYDAGGLVLEYRVQITLELTFQRLDTGEVLWEVPVMREVEEYRVASNVLTNEARKAEAIGEIARILAERIHDLIVERF
jgi:hypothetical protein